MALYSKFVIYELYCNNPLIKKNYIGSTRYLDTRIGVHKYVCNKKIGNEYKWTALLQTFIRDNGGWDNWNSKIIYEGFGDDTEMFKKEYEYIDKQNPDESLNTRKTPGRWVSLTKEERKDDFKNYQKGRNKIYIDCCCGKKIKKATKSIHNKTLTHNNIVFIQFLFYMNRISNLIYNNDFGNFCINKKNVVYNKIQKMENLKRQVSEELEKESKPKIRVTEKSVAQYLTRTKRVHKLYGRY
jgi:hypothetical protein